MSSRLIHIALMVLLSAGVVKGQNLTTSPYSFYGIGDIEHFNNGQTQGLGGAGIALNNKFHLNLKNPASYASFDTLSFKFEFGARSKLTKLSSATSSENVDDHGLAYLAMGFPITKRWHSTFALVPMSTVGYNIEQSTENESIGTVNQVYKGEGGLNQLMWGNSFKISNAFAVGVNASYTFGRLSYFKSLFLPDISSSSNSIAESKYTVKGFTYQLGVQYSTRIKNKYKLSIGLSLENESKLPVDAFNIAGPTYYTYTDYLNNLSVYDTIVQENVEGDIIIPTKFGVGIAFSDNEHYIAAFDYEFQKWEDAEIMGVNAGLSNLSKIAGGIEYTPDMNHPKFLRRLHYRFGGNYTNSYLNINNNQLTSFGVTFGVGIPVRRTKTSFNINFEYGQRGNTENNLIKENYAIISLTLSLSDIWFYKRKFD